MGGWALSRWDGLAGQCLPFPWAFCHLQHEEGCVVLLSVSLLPLQISVHIL